MADPRIKAANGLHMLATELGRDSGREVDKIQDWTIVQIQNNSAIMNQITNMVIWNSKLSPLQPMKNFGPVSLTVWPPFLLAREVTRHIIGRNPMLSGVI